MDLKNLKLLLFGRLIHQKEPVYPNPSIGISFLRNDITSGIVNIYNMRRKAAGNITITIENDNKKRYSYSTGAVTPVCHVSVSIKEFTDKNSNPFEGFPHGASCVSNYGVEKYIFDGSVFRKIK